MSSTSLALFIKQQLELNEHSPEFTKVFGFTVKYLARGYGKGKTAQYHRDLESVVDFDELPIKAIDFRKGVSDCRDYVVNLRYYILAVAASTNATSYAQSSWPSFSVPRVDAVFAWNSLLKIPANRKQLMLESKSQNKDFDATWVTPQALRLRLLQSDSILNELYPSIKRKCRKDLRWVVKAHNQSMEDLQCDLVCTLLQVYYQSLPNNFSREHQLNYLRASVGSRINNMQDYYSAEKRQRMFSDGKDGYEIRYVSDNQLGSNVDGAPISYEDLMSEDARSDEMDTLERNLSLDELLDKTRGTKRGKLYQVLSGRAPDELTNWLRANNKLSSRFNCAVSWLSSRSYGTICSTLSMWLEVPVSTIQIGLSNFAGQVGYA